MRIYVCMYSTAQYFVPASQETVTNAIGIDLGDAATLQTYYQIFAITFTVLFVAAIIVVIILVSVACLHGQTCWLDYR